MKRILSIIEIFLLTMITTFNGLRFDGKNSQPYVLDTAPLELTLFILLILVLVLRTAILWKQNFRKTFIKPNYRLLVFGLFIIAISKDLYYFSKWAIYAGSYGEFLIVLLLPIIIGLANERIKNKNDTPTINKANA